MLKHGDVLEMVGGPFDGKRRKVEALWPGVPGGGMLCDAVLMDGPDGTAYLYKLDRELGRWVCAATPRQIVGPGDAAP